MTLCNIRDLLWRPWQPVTSMTFCNIRDVLWRSWPLVTPVLQPPVMSMTSCDVHHLLWCWWLQNMFDQPQSMQIQQCVWGYVRKSIHIELYNLHLYKKSSTFSTILWIMNVTWYVRDIVQCSCSTVLYMVDKEWEVIWWTRSVLLWMSSEKVHMMDSKCNIHNLVD